MSPPPLPKLLPIATTPCSVQGIYNLTTSTLGFGLLVPFPRASGSGPQSPLSKRPFRSANSASVSKPCVRSSAKSFSSFAQSAAHRGFFRGGSKECFQRLLLVVVAVVVAPVLRPAGLERRVYGWREEGVREGGGLRRWRGSVHACVRERSLRRSCLDHGGQPQSKIF